MSGKLKIGNIELTESPYFLRIGGVSPYQGRSDDYAPIRIPGRVGELLPQQLVKIGNQSYPDWPDGLPNEIREYTAGLYMRSASNAAVEGRFQKLRALLMPHYGTYFKLSDSYEPSFFRMATYYGDMIPERKGAGNNFEFPLTFSCDPRRFIAGVPDVAITSTTHTLSPENSGITDFTIVAPARPIITVEQYEYVEMVIRFLLLETNAEYGKITMAPFQGIVTIDTNDLTAKGAYSVENGGPLITDVTGEPCLLPGGCKFNRSAGTARVTVEPRWWVR